MNEYIYLLATGLITLLLILITPPDRFYHNDKKWIKKFTWRAWLTIIFSLLTISLTLYNKVNISKEDANKQSQINRLEQNGKVITSQLDKFGLKLDSTNKIISKYDSSKYFGVIEKQRPILDICKQGISTKQINDTSIFVTIPYCSDKKAAAYNVKIQSIVILRSGVGLMIFISNSQEEKFPQNISITYELGKSIQYVLSPVKPYMLDSLYFYIKGSYTNNDNTLFFRISDLFKKSAITNEWLRPIGDEDVVIRKYLKEKGLL